MSKSLDYFNIGSCRHFQFLIFYFLSGSSPQLANFYLLFYYLLIDISDKIITNPNPLIAKHLIIKLFLRHFILETPRKLLHLHLSSQILAYNPKLLLNIHDGIVGKVHPFQMGYRINVLHLVNEVNFIVLEVEATQGRMVHYVRYLPDVVMRGEEKFQGWEN